MRLIGLAVILSLVLAPLTVGAQQPGKVPRIGYLNPGYFNPETQGGTRLEAFQNGLRERGWVEGQNVVVEYRYAEGATTGSTIQQPIWPVSRLT